MGPVSLFGPLPWIRLFLGIPTSLGFRDEGMFEVGRPDLDWTQPVNGLLFGRRVTCLGGLGKEGIGGKAAKTKAQTQIETGVGLEALIGSLMRKQS
jgi:hypothetical protein